jgi:hypothetical protein
VCILGVLWLFHIRLICSFIGQLVIIDTSWFLMVLSLFFWDQAVELDVPAVFLLLPPTLLPFDV